MNKNALISKLSMPILLLGIALSSAAYIPIARKLLGIDNSITLPFSTTIVLLIAGLMAAIAGMISVCRKRATDPIDYQLNATQSQPSNAQLSLPHWLGLSLLLMIPFINFILIYFAWLSQRRLSAALDYEYRHALNFQITIQLYGLLSVFLTPIGIGFIMLALLLLLHIAATLWVALRTLNGHQQRYPASINIIPVS